MLGHEPRACVFPVLPSQHQSEHRVPERTPCPPRVNQREAHYLLLQSNTVNPDGTPSGFMDLVQSPVTPPQGFF